MQLIHRFDAETAARPVRGRKTVLLAGPHLEGLAQTCRDCGLDVEVVAGRYEALAAIGDDPTGYCVLVLHTSDADGLVAVEAAARLQRSIAPRVVTVLVASDQPPGLPPAIAFATGIRLSRREVPRKV